MFEKTTTFNKLIKLLKDNLIENPKNQLEILCLELLGINKSDLILLKSFTKKQYNILLKAVKKRCKHIPLQLIIGNSEFLDIKIKESKHTLKPRPETELLTSIIIEDFLNKQVNVLDLCCGSGCIGLSLKKAGHNVTCSDVSGKAIKMTKQNAKLNNLKINVVKSDMFKNINQTFDVIVSNPPYIKKDDIAQLADEVKLYDPTIALDGGEDGYEFYNIISNQAQKFLNKNGRLYLECGLGQAKTIKKLLSKNFKNIKIINDYNNIERFIKADKK